MAKYVCSTCGYVYDESLGDEENNIKDFVSMFGEKIEKVKEDAISSFKSEYLKDFFCSLLSLQNIILYSLYHKKTIRY